MNEIKSTLLSCYVINNTCIPNRLVVAPMTRVSANEDGTASNLMKAYYERFADGEFGLIITEGLYTDELYSKGYFKQVGLATEAHGISWEPIISSIHHKGAKVIAQLMHAGALSQHNCLLKKGIGPSPVQPMGKQMSLYYGEGNYLVPNEMNDKDIDDVIQGFVDSAKLAKTSGFDGVEIHGANGYLLDQFLTDYTNKRADKYGGELANRLRIYKEVLDSVRVAVGDDFIIGVRLSQKKVNDNEYLWPEREAAAEYIFKSMRNFKVDYIHTAESLVSDPAFEEGKSLACFAKKFSGLPIIANGGISEYRVAAEVIERNQAEFISLGKAALANQNWPNLLRNNSDTRRFDPAILTPIADLDNANRYFSKS